MRLHIFESWLNPGASVFSATEGAEKQLVPVATSIKN
jgi:hypothetical protein